jgi:hypothetical protein
MFRAEAQLLLSVRGRRGHEKARELMRLSRGDNEAFIVLREIFQCTITKLHDVAGVWLTVGSGTAVGDEDETRRWWSCGSWRTRLRRTSTMQAWAASR